MKNQFLKPEIPQIKQQFPLLLSDYDKLNVKYASYTPSPRGYQPLQRPIDQYLQYGIINLDKPSGPSSHEIVSWVKRILNCDRTGHSGTLDPAVTGNLLICLNRATRLVKSQQELGKQYVAILQFNNFEQFINKVGKEEFKRRCIEALKTLIAPQLQRPPAEGCAVKRVLRLRTIYAMKFLECDLQNGRLLFTVDCESGTYIRTLCFHIGLLVGCEAYMLELRRTRSGFLNRDTNMVTLHNVLDAFYLYQTTGDESLLRKVVMPLEFLLIKEKKVIIKDSAVNAICHGASLLIQGVLRYQGDIQIGDRVVLVTTKGEAVALGVATMSSVDIASGNHGVVCKPTRVIMERDLYEKQWKLGQIALLRQKLIKEEKLGKHGEIIEGKTPQSYIDRNLDTQKFLLEAGKTCQNAVQVSLDQLIKYESCVDGTTCVMCDGDDNGGNIASGNNDNGGNNDKSGSKQHQIQQQPQQQQQQQQQVQQQQETQQETEQGRKHRHRHHKHSE